MYGCNLWYQLYVDMPQNAKRMSQKPFLMELMGTSILGESEIHMPLPVTNHMSDAGSGHLFTPLASADLINNLLPILILLFLPVLDPYFPSGLIATQ